jgi:hypothetical protein
LGFGLLLANGDILPLHGDQLGLCLKWVRHLADALARVEVAVSLDKVADMADPTSAFSAAPLLRQSSVESVLTYAAGNSETSESTLPKKPLARSESDHAPASHKFARSVSHAPWFGSSPLLAQPEQTATPEHAVGGEPGPRGQIFIIMENLVAPFAHPSVLDLKLGTRQHADDAHPEKRAKQEAKCRNTTSGTLGLRCVVQVDAVGCEAG